LALVLLLTKPNGENLMNLGIILFGLLLSLNCFSSSREYVDTIGSSPKGQYVAFETYGFKPEEKKFYSSIKIMNVWKKQYVGSIIEAEMPAFTKDSLSKVRAKARTLALENLKKFQISG